MPTRPPDPRQALVLFSGGQDSIACVAWVLNRFARVETVGFNDGRRHCIALDCRAALRRELAAPMLLETPLMWLNRAQTWALTETLGGEALNALIIEHSHTCYLGERGERHAWGHGCGACPACQLRRSGHADWQAQRVVAAAA